MSSPYISWVKSLPPTKFSLASSGLSTFPLADLHAPWHSFSLDRPSPGYPYEPLYHALAKKCAVSPDSLVSAIGASQGIHLPLAALLSPSDEVLIEHPTYDPILSLALHLGARVKRFHRRHDSAFQIDPDEVARLATSSTRLIVLTNLHNPTGAFTDVPTLLRLGEIARRSRARVLVNEIYLEMLLVQPPPANSPAAAAPIRSAFHLGPEFVAIGSLTKAYGLSGLRCGWILAEPTLARRLWQLNDLFTNIPSHIAEQLSVIALNQLDRITARARDILDTNRILLDHFLSEHPALDAVRPPCGTIVFPRLPSSVLDALKNVSRTDSSIASRPSPPPASQSAQDSAAQPASELALPDPSELFCALLREKFDTSAVPGKFFESPHHIRIGIGAPTNSLIPALARLSSALSSFSP